MFYAGYYQAGIFMHENLKIRVRIFTSYILSLVPRGADKKGSTLCIYGCMYVCMNVCIYACIYAWIYVYVLYINFVAIYVYSYMHICTVQLNASIALFCHRPIIITQYCTEAYITQELNHSPVLAVLAKYYGAILECAYTNKYPKIHIIFQNCAALRSTKRVLKLRS